MSRQFADSGPDNSPTAAPAIRRHYLCVTAAAAALSPPRVSAAPLRPFNARLFNSRHRRRRRRRPRRRPAVVIDDARPTRRRRHPCLSSPASIEFAGGHVPPTRVDTLNSVRPIKTAR